MGVWVLVGQVNAYDQYGDYFYACWPDKPSAQQLINANLSIEKWNAEELLSSGSSSQEPYPGAWESWDLIKIEKEYYHGS